MAKCFGTWLRDYDGDEEWIQQLSVKWNKALVGDYLNCGDYKSPDDVARRMAMSSKQKVPLLFHSFRAYQRYADWRGR